MKNDTLKFRLSRNLKRLRKERNLSQFQLAELADVSEHTINSIEIRRMWASDVTLQKICEAFGVDAVSLLLPCAEDIALEDTMRKELQRVVERCVMRTVSETIKKLLCR
ncbi:MAG: helix-turn-helix transcriptional regulator [Treponema sp.]|nr:helix-turn-helix transcriptional regulator [Treponema sp.]